MRILWQSDYLVPTGFGQQAEHITVGLTKKGHVIDVIGWQFRGKPITIDNITVFPTQQGRWGSDQYANKLNRLKPDLVVTLSDFWQVSYMADVPRPCPWIAIVAVDGNKLPHNFKHLSTYPDEIVVFSQFGKRILDENKIQSTYIPHGIDTKLFYPVSESEKSFFKQQLGIGVNDLVVGFVGRTNPRKHLMRVLRTFEKLRHKYKNLWLYLHTDLKDDLSRIDLEELAQVLEVADHIKITDVLWCEGVPTEMLRQIYGAFDIYFTTTSREGFGVPMLEAMACGVPVVATNYTTPPELVGIDRGLLVNVQDYAIEDDSGVPNARCDINHAVEQISVLLDDEEMRKQFGRNASEFAKRYDYRKLIGLWDNLIRSYEMDLEDAVIGKQDDIVKRVKQQALNDIRKKYENGTDDV